MGSSRLAVVRLLAVVAVAFGLVYIGWRWTGTVAWDAWWIAVPLVLAETYSLGETVLYSLTMWNARRRPPAPPAPEGLSVDVFVTTYNEPVDLVLRTAIAARDMTYPHATWILDDGNRPELEVAASRVGVGYITRGPEWEGRPRFAKAGNVNNALFRTSGDLVAILDADQVPEPRFLDRVLGYFEDEEVAFVQTPQHFWNVPPSDPLGTQAELFYGPIQQGKDGWGAAFFCGSNAVLRREALMALGLTRFSRDARGAMRAALRAGRSRLQDLLSQLAVREPAAMPVAEQALAAVRRAEGQFRRGDVLAEITSELRSAFAAALVQAPAAPGPALAQAFPEAHVPHETTSLPEDVAGELLAELDGVLERVDVARTDQALTINPLDTTTITEDMATAMHLHAMGWTSVYHHEVLVHGLAPEDVGTALSQRLRWATGSMQVFFRDNPLLVRGLSLAQRLMYLGTMTSYLSGFAALVYLAAPVLFLTLGVFPLHADPALFFLHFLPFFVACQLLFQVSGKGSRGLWRGQQMSFALFPTWIAATLSGASAVFLGRHVAFSVTSKTQQATGTGYRHVLPQVVVTVVLLVASAVGVARMLAGEASAPATFLTLGWVAVDLALLSAALRAARYTGPGDTVVDPVPPSVALLAAQAVGDVLDGDDALPTTFDPTEVPLDLTVRHVPRSSPWPPSSAHPTSP
ncbi:glycosyltransferase family 2 protein [Oerskovia sp. KBS0722]|uniref:glycosyltransferase family 2 protein n=1 Tax=Oerskovia sp. KBS0722 TaxID=1179673 RepID=UPI00110DAAF2|nr:glycosyltransferase family 2 protein [Oerskovia sp. KBS0722]QDW62709.1 glycosyltransferase [Oerskovia sp. KBS0722]